MVYSDKNQSMPTVLGERLSGNRGFTQFKAHQRLLINYKRQMTSLQQKDLADTTLIIFQHHQ